MNGQEMPRCHPHERLWQGICVDCGMRDVWLERLNNMSLFNQERRSCEGVVAAGGGTIYGHPYVAAETCDTNVLAAYLRSPQAFEDLATSSFVGTLPKPLQSDGISLRLKLRFSHRRETPDMPEALVDWFDETTAALAPFEAACYHLAGRILSSGG